MKTMLLEGGDLVVGASSDYQMITDAAKVQQEVRCALVEPLGNDRFHPGWGSTISDLVGEPVTPFLRTQVLSEVNRVVGNYAAVQKDKVETDSLSGSSTRFSTSEIVAAVRGVSVASRFETMKVRVAIGTLAGSTVTVSEDIG